MLHCQQDSTPESESVNMGSFGNEFDVKLQIGIGVAVFILAPVFGYFYNRFIDTRRDGEHTSLWVAVGVTITIILAALISWKSAVLMCILFALTGLPMIIGDIQRNDARAKKAKSTRGRKRLPYAANGLIDEARMAVTDMINHLSKFIETNDNKYLHLAQIILARLVSILSELKGIQEK